MCGGATAAVVLDRPDYHLPGEATTFDGRDIFAPVAAHLASGVSLDAVGSAIDPNALLPGVLPVSEVNDDTVSAEVLWIDHFGNAQLNVDPDDLSPLGSRFSVRVGDNVRPARTASAYADIAAGEIGLVTDSAGLVSIAVQRGSAAQIMGIAPGASVTLTANDDGGVSTPVELGRRPE